jgi:hypothetical protein
VIGGKAGLYTYRISLLEAASETIWEIENEAEGSYSALYSHSLRQVAGALRRQLQKRFGSDYVELLDVTIISDAYKNEVARVVSEWPDSKNFTRPSAFFGITCRLLRRFAAHRWYDTTDELCTRIASLDSEPALNDASAPVTLWNDNWNLLFASPSALGFLEISKDTRTHRANDHLTHVVSESDHDRFLQDQEYIRSGQKIADVVYNTSLDHIRAIHVLLAKILYDDDRNRIGQMWITRPVLRELGACVTHRRPRTRSLRQLLPALAAAAFAAHAMLSNPVDTSFRCMLDAPQLSSIEDRTGSCADLIQNMHP